jgi:membrane protease YdiL (CAAX protease family)
MDPNALKLPAEVEALVGGIALVLLVGWLTVWIRIVRRLRRGETLVRQGPPRVVPWGLGAILAVMLVYFIVSQLLAAGYVGYRRSHTAPAAAVAKPGGDTAGSGLPKGLESPAAATGKAGHKLSSLETIGLVSAVNVAMLVLVPLTLYVLSRATWKDPGLGGGGVGRELGLGVVAALAVAPPCYALMGLLSRLTPRKEHPLQTMLANEQTTGTAILAMVTAVILAPAVEELLFRGILLPWLQKVFEPRESAVALAPSDEVGVVAADAAADAEVEAWSDASSPEAALPADPFRVSGSLGRMPMGWAWPNVITAALFASLHAAQWPAPLALFPLALVLGWLAIRTGRIWASIALHACFNGISTAMMLLIFFGGVPVPKPGGAVPEPPIAPVPAPAVLAPCPAAALVRVEAWRVP